MATPRLYPARIFRDTPSVYFADAWIPGQNGLDVVTHHGAAISPPYAGRLKQFYVHAHQTDFNRVVYGERVFELVYPDGGHYYVHLDANSGALEIPPYVYHRSISCPEGSVLLNHAVRDAEYDETKEFFPRATDSDEVLALGYLKPASFVGPVDRILLLLADHDQVD
jgi:hypothetical protein